jgi:hypothetical protein
MPVTTARVRSPRDGGWLTPHEARDRLAADLDGHTVQARTLQHWCRAGRLPSKRLGRKLLIHWSDLLACLDAWAAPPNGAPSPPNATEPSDTNGGAPHA